MTSFLFAVGTVMALLAMAKAASMDIVGTRPPVDEPQNDRRAVISGSASGGQGRGYECAPDLHTLCAAEWPLVELARTP